MSTRAARVLLGLTLAIVLVVAGVLGARALADLGQGLSALAGGDLVTSPGGEASDDRPAPPAGVPRPAQEARVDRVVDGDTIRVRVSEPGGRIPPTETVRVRLLNIDAPELDHPERGSDCGASEATALMEHLTPPGSRVWLVADVEDRDHYGRPLRGVWNERGDFVNAELAQAGWAQAVLFPPNDRFHQRMVELEQEARDARLGVWTACEGFPS